VTSSRHRIVTARRRWQETTISSVDQPDELDRSGTRLLDGLHDHETSPDNRRVVVCARCCVLEQGEMYECPACPHVYPQFRSSERVVVENVYRHRPALCRVAGKDGCDSLKRQDRTARQASRESEADSRNRYPMDIVLTPWLSIGINLLAYLCPSEQEHEGECGCGCWCGC
jgi:hypothetical protein